MKSSIFTLSYPCRNLSFTLLYKPFSRSRPFPAIHSPPFVRLSHGQDDRRQNLANVPLTQDDRTRRSSSSMSQPSSTPPSSKMTTETGYVTLDTAQLFTKTWIPATAPIALLLFVHGFSEYVERYDHVFSHFAERGIKTFGWDQRGFGRSAIKKADCGKTGGTDKAIEDMDYFVKQYQQEAQKAKIPFFIWGHSMGGALALTYAGRKPDLDIRGIVSQSPLVKLVEPPARPLVWIVSILCKVLPNFQLYNPVLGKHISRDPEVAKRYDEDPLVHGTGTLLGIYTMLTEGEQLLDNPPKITYPLLVQHGTDDKVTSFDAVREMYAKLPPGNPDREFKAWEGYFHELHNEPEDERNEAIKYIADWILARCGDDTTAPRARL